MPSVPRRACRSSSQRRCSDEAQSDAATARQPPDTRPRVPWNIRPSIPDSQTSRAAPPDRRLPPTVSPAIEEGSHNVLRISPRSASSSLGQVAMHSLRTCASFARECLLSPRVVPTRWLRLEILRSRLASTRHVDFQAAQYRVSVGRNADTFE